MAITAAVALAALLLIAPAAFAGRPQARTNVPRHSFGRGTSTNWSGYAVTGSAATHVIGTWTVKSVSCASGESSWSSPWVGIDGDNSNTVEQIGTDSDCQNGTPTYYAWYEMYPKSLVVINMTVRPGDSFTGEVTGGSGGQFTLKLTRNSATSFQTTQSSKRARRSSVEWVLEGPSNGLLSNFGSQPFSAASATISGQTGSIGSFGNADPITMVSSQGVTRAVPSSLSSGGTAFSVAWRHR